MLSKTVWRECSARLQVQIGLKHVMQVLIYMMELLTSMICCCHRRFTTYAVIAE